MKFQQKDIRTVFRYVNIKRFYNFIQVPLNSKRLIILNNQCHPREYKIPQLIRRYNL